MGVYFQKNIPKTYSKITYVIQLKSQESNYPPIYQIK